MRITTSKQLSNYLKDTRLSLKLSQSIVARKVGIRHLGGMSPEQFE